MTGRHAHAKQLLIEHLRAAPAPHRRVARAVLREAVNAVAAENAWPIRRSGKGKGAAGSQALSRAIYDLVKAGEILADDEFVWTGPAWPHDRACRRKVGYADAADALRELSRLQNGQHRSNGWEPQSVYRCATCNCWHLTSKPPQASSDPACSAAAVPA